MSNENNKELAARFLAVQACYEMLQTGKSLRVSRDEYLERGLQIDDEQEGIETAKPSAGMFKKILATLDAHLAEVDEILKAHQKANAPALPPVESVEPVEGVEDAQEQPAPVKEKKPTEPLLKAILMCGIAEIMVHQDIDTALIIDDYLNVTHGYYEKGQVSLVNGVLDTLAKNLRA